MQRNETNRVTLYLHTNFSWRGYKAMSPQCQFIKKFRQLGFTQYTTPDPHIARQHIELNSQAFALLL